MPNKIAKLFSFVFFLLFPLQIFAWNAIGHMVVANIAYQNLKPDVKQKVNKIVHSLTEQYPEILGFQEAAFWPDAIRDQRIETYTHWHYVDNAITTDGSELKNLIDTDNASWAYRNVVTVVKNERANPYERTRFMAFLEHITGDLHQPLHTVSNITAHNANGDRGGNGTYVIYKNAKINLHKLWDEGVGEFESYNKSSKHIDDLTAKIASLYPQSYFGKRALDLDQQDWIDESVEIAKNVVYNMKENEPVSDAYIRLGSQKAEEQVALAGYRLANTLNQILA